MIDKNYAPQEIEQKWYAYWLENKLFASKPNPNKEAYTIVIPPPNVTGVLHMGHMLNNTIQDVLIRKARMEGKEACWVLTSSMGLFLLSKNATICANVGS